MTSNQPYSAVVSEVGLRSDDPADLVSSNVKFINALRQHALLRTEELPRDGLLSYYVDYYLGQVNNGGFSQFVWNSHWEASVINPVRDGLSAMGAMRHLHVFGEGSELVSRLRRRRLAKFLRGGYFGSDNRERDELDTLNSRFTEASQTEDLLVLNAAWLRGLPGLAVLSDEAMHAEIARIASAVTDRAARVAAARAGEPPYLTIIRILCDRADCEFRRLTGANPAHMHEGQRTLAHHFLTDLGHHYMIEVGGRALMFKGGSHELVAELRTDG